MNKTFSKWIMAGSLIVLVTVLGVYLWNRQPEEDSSLNDMEEDIIKQSESVNTLTSRNGEKEDEISKGQLVVDDLPEEIRKLLSYDSWTDYTQVVLCTKEDIQRSGMVEEFQQILNGDFSEVEGLRNEEEREELMRDYEKREKWKYMLQDMNGDGIEELCIKDGKGRIGIFYAEGNEAYVSGLIEIWTFGEMESNLLSEDRQWGTNAFFLNNGQIVEISVSRDENNSCFYLRVCYLHEYGTLPSLEQMRIHIINDISTGYGVNYKESGIYYEIDREENEGGYPYKEATEEEAIAWCKDYIYPYMTREEWFTVP